MKLKIIFEKGNGELWGRIEGGNFLLTTAGQDAQAVTESLKSLLRDHIEHEGREEKKWKNADVDQITFEYYFDLQAFFEEYNFLNLSAIAQIADINRSLLAQYANGIKHPSLQQAKKIETVVHALAKKLSKVALVA